MLRRRALAKILANRKLYIKLSLSTRKKIYREVKVGKFAIKIVKERGLYKSTILTILRNVLERFFRKIVPRFK